MPNGNAKRVVGSILEAVKTASKQSIGYKRDGPFVLHIFYIFKLVLPKVFSSFPLSGCFVLAAKLFMRVAKSTSDAAP